jgi:hypothetical protein
MKPRTFAPVFALFLLSCSARETATLSGAAAHTTFAAPSRAIAAMQTRDRKVTIFSDRGTLLVTVHDDAGKLVQGALTLDALRAEDPFLYQACTSAIASQGGGTYLDARLDAQVGHRATLHGSLDR